MKNSRLTRRGFLKTAAAAAIAPTIIPSSAFGANSRIAVGIIGTGDHGTNVDLKGLLHQKDAQVMALCDVDLKNVERAKQMTLEKYGEGSKSGAASGCYTTQDWRELVARADVDAVAVATPDHWHVLCAIGALEAGKDVLCEKPLSLTIEEGRALADAAAKHGGITITASENRSKTNFLQACELVRNGRIGTLKHTRVELPGGWWVRDLGHGTSQEPAPVPEGLDYAMWQGQVAHKPFSPGRFHFNWRWDMDYSGGMLTDWGAHMLDIAQWGNGTERTGPVRVEGTGVMDRDAYYNVASAWGMTYEYASGATLFCTNREPNTTTPGLASVRFEGTHGWIECDWFSIKASDKELLKTTFGPDDVRLRTCAGGEHRDWLDCIQSREPTYAPFEVGHRTTSMSHLANICLQLGRKLEWNPDAEKFVNDPEADALIGRTMQNGWSLPA